MKKILIATPIYPPSAGGPATHAKKLEEFFGVRAKVFVFEKWNFLPSGIRHLVAFIEIFYKSIFQVKIIFALDGFSVALPAVLVGKILRIPVVLRIGGDLVHEQYVEMGHMVPMNLFYEKLRSGEINLGKALRIKMFVQKFVTENCSGVVFNTDWQKVMYESFYKLPKNIWVLYNPSDICPTPSVEKSFVGKGNRENFFITSITRDVKFKNLEFVKSIINEINLENTLNRQIFFDTRTGPRDDVLRRISESDLYIAGAISDIAPNQLLEALSLGVPALCTENTGYKSVLDNYDVVDFVDTQNQLELKKAIISNLDYEKNQKTRENLSKFRWPYSWEEYFKSYERIIEKLCNSK